MTTITTISTTTTTRRLIAFAGAVAIAFGSAACSKDLSPATTSPTSTPTTKATSTTSSAPVANAKELLAKVKANALSATSGAFKGQVATDGSLVSIDYKGTADGKTADVTVKADEFGGRVRIIAVPKGVYMQADKGFWKKSAGATAASRFAGNWVKAPGGLDAIAGELSLSSMLKKALDDTTYRDFSDKVREETIDGIDCWVLTDRRGKTGGALFIAKSTLQLVRFSGSTRNPGSIDFSQWNADLAIKAPAASEIVPLS